MIYLLENEEGQWLRRFLYDKSKVNTVTELELTDDVTKAWSFSHRKDAQGYIDESFESESQQRVFDSQEFKVTEHEFVDIEEDVKSPVTHEENGYIAYFIEYSDGSWYDGNYSKDINGTECDIGITKDPYQAFGFGFREDANEYLEKHINWFGKKEFKVTEHEFVGVPVFFASEDYLEREELLKLLKGVVKELRNKYSVRNEDPSDKDYLVQAEEYLRIGK